MDHSDRGDQVGRQPGAGNCAPGPRLGADWLRQYYEIAETDTKS